MPSLIVYTPNSEDDVTLTANGASYVFSEKKQNRLLFTDNMTADALLASYGNMLTLFARYDGERYTPSAGIGSIGQVAVVMVNYRTPAQTKRAYESFRQFYPTLPMYVIDNGSSDESAAYVKSIAGKCTTAIVNPYNYGHGPALHQAAGILRERGFRYMFALDSDTETKRGGFLEAMLARLGSGYAIGKRYWTCEHGFVSNSERGVPYVHPHAALHELNQYSVLRPFALHGAPCIHNMIDAKLRGMAVLDFPIEDYVYHYGMETVKTIRVQDVNAAYLFPQRPPLVSFIVRYDGTGTLEDCVDTIARQSSADYEIVPIRNDDADVYSQPVIVSRVHGMYMYVMNDTDRLIDDDFVAVIAQIACNELYPNIIIAHTVDDAGNTLPGSDAWRNGPVRGQIIAQNLIIRRELWMTAAINYCGRWDNFETIKDVFNRKDWPAFYWLERVIANVR
jgi:glycosyltransferase involved in cell wall biosynthesis